MVAPWSHPRRLNQPVDAHFKTVFRGHLDATVKGTRISFCRALLHQLRPRPKRLFQALQTWCGGCNSQVAGTVIGPTEHLIRSSTFGPQHTSNSFWLGSDSERYMGEMRLSSGDQVTGWRQLRLAKSPHASPVRRLLYTPLTPPGPPYRSLGGPSETAPTLNDRVPL